MKTVLAATAVLALSLSPALADCAGHSAKVDKKDTTASISTTTDQEAAPMRTASNTTASPSEE